jgi:hypothetical protein
MPAASPSIDSIGSHMDAIPAPVGRSSRCGVIVGHKAQANWIGPVDGLIPLFPLSGRRGDYTSSPARRHLISEPHPGLGRMLWGDAKGFALNAIVARTLLDRTSSAHAFSRSGCGPRHDSRALRERRPFEQRMVYLNVIFGHAVRRRSAARTAAGPSGNRASALGPAS